MSFEEAVALVRRMDALWLRLGSGEMTPEEFAEYEGLCDAADEWLGMERDEEAMTA